MSKRKLTCLLLCLLIFSQLAADSDAAQAINPRHHNEKFVIKSLQRIHGAQITYQVINNAANFGSFDDLRRENFIDDALASGEKYGYRFELTKTDRTATDQPGFYVTATPRRYGKTGRRSFYIDETGELRGADKNGAAATAADPSIDWCFVYESEKCVVAGLRTLHGAQMTYQSSVGNGIFGNLNELRSAGLIDRILATGTIHGYRYTLTIVDPTSTTPAFFKVSAIPVRYGVTGARSFYVDAIGVVRGADKRGEPADENDPPIND